LWISFFRTQLILIKKVLKKALKQGFFEISTLRECGVYLIKTVVDKSGETRLKIFIFKLWKMKSYPQFFEMFEQPQKFPFCEENFIFFWQVLR
jgi:hypothetical protein